MAFPLLCTLSHLSKLSPLNKETKGERRRQRSVALPARLASPLFFNLPFLPLKTGAGVELALPRGNRRQFTKLLLSLLSHAGCWRAGGKVGKGAGDKKTPLYSPAAFPPAHRLEAKVATVTPNALRLKRPLHRRNACNPKIGAAAGSCTRTICLEDSHAPVQHHCRKKLGSRRGNPPRASSSVRLLCRGTVVKDRRSSLLRLSLRVGSACRSAHLRWEDLTPRLILCDESPRLQPKLACLPAGQRGEPNSSDENPGTGRTPVANHRRGHFQDRARQLTSSASGRAIL
jgi:hypothetical protein